MEWNLIFCFVLRLFAQHVFMIHYCSCMYHTFISIYIMFHCGNVPKFIIHLLMDTRDVFQFLPILNKAAMGILGQVFFVDMFICL